MSSQPVRLARSPGCARIVPGSLVEYERTQHERHGQELHDAAYAEGYAEATRTAAGALDAATEQLESLRAEMADSLAESVAQLAVEMLQELLRVELIARNYDIVSIVRATIAEAGSSPGATAIHVHPDDAARLADVPFRTGTVIEADPAVRRGDVQMHTAQGLLVRDMDACAASIRERILAEVKSC